MMKRKSESSFHRRPLKRYNNERYDDLSDHHLYDLFKTFVGKHKGYYLIDVPAQTVKKMIDDYGEGVFLGTLSEFIYEERIAFPYRWFYVKEEEVLRKFENLKGFEPVSEVVNEKYVIPTTYLSEDVDWRTDFDGEYLLFPSTTDEYFEINSLRDYFRGLERARMRSTIGKKESTYDHWYTKKLHCKWLPLLMKRLVKDGEYYDLNTYNLRECLYFLNQEPTGFKATVAVTVYKKFNSKKILDLSSGWGDRLLGALSLEDSIDYYVGVDPNPDLVEGYHEMIELLTKDPTKYHMISSPFEADFEFPEEKNNFDIVFTSPPYFDYEIYGHGAPGQSTDSYANFLDWTVKFLFVAVAKSWYFLNENGILAINISETVSQIKDHYYYTEPMNLFIQAFLINARYRGAMSFCGSTVKNSRPIWTFEKDSTNDNNSEKEKALYNLKTHYPKIYRKLKHSTENFSPWISDLTFPN